MILKNLTLINFRKFKNATIEFPDGITGIVGLNGSGKSTIFEAIAWVLYGPVAARTSADQIKRNGTLPSDPCRVELEFVFDENNYRIIREMSGKNFLASATVTINGKIAATSAETVSKFIQKKLGMDFKSFFTSIFAKQKELNTLSSMIASERRPLILKMLGIDPLDEIIKDIKSDKKEKDLIIERLSRNLIDEDNKDKINIYANSIKDFKEQQKVIKNSIKDLKEKIQIIKEELKSLDNIYLSKKKEYEEINNQKERLIEKKLIFENKQKIQIEINNLNKKIKERHKHILKEKEKLKNFLNLDKHIDSNENFLLKNNNDIEESVKKIEQKNTLKDQIKRDLLDVESKWINIKKLGAEAKCPTCERILSDQYRFLLKKFETDKKKLKKEIESHIKDIKNEQNEKDKLIRKKQALQKKRNYLFTQLREKERIDATILNITTELKREKDELQNKKIEVEKIGIVTFDVKEFDSIKSKVDSLYKKFQSSFDTYNREKDLLSELHLELEKKESDKKLIVKEIQNLNEKITKLEGLKKQIKNEKKTAYYLAMLTEIMASFRTHLISRIRPTLSSYSSDYFEQLTNGKYTELELDDNYNLLIYDNGTAYSIERYSGGEEDLANLCLRLAISEVITERAGGVFNFIILDEIFGSQDMYRRQNIMKSLKGLSSKFRQIFLITHIDEIKNYMENAITVIEEENGLSKIKIE
jgi:exonuclease SbcC